MGKGYVARVLALLLALLFAAGYAFLPADVENSIINNSGRKKLEIPTDTELEWEWKPELQNATELLLTLSGRKKAAGMTVYAWIQSEDGTEAASVAQQIDEMGDGDAICLQGDFSKSDFYKLRLRAEGEGSIKVKGEEDEDGAFYPLLQEKNLEKSRNPVVLYFAVGFLLLALTPVSSVLACGKKLRKKKGNGTDLLPAATFLLIFFVGILVSMYKPPFEQGIWGSWDEEIHIGAMEAMVPMVTGSFRDWLAGMITWHPGYLPLAVGETIARIFTSNPEVIYRTAVSVSSFVYAGMAALAVGHAPRYKVTFLVAATMPTIMFLMTSISYDTVVIGSILLGLSLVLESVSSDEPVTSFRAITMIALMAFGTVAKPAYSLILLSMMMIPAQRMGGKKNAWIFRGFVLLITIWCFAAVALPGAYDSVRAGDERFIGTVEAEGDSARISASEQLEYMLANPAEGLTKPVRYLWKNQHFLMNMGISHWAYLGNRTEWNDLYLMLLLVIAPLCAWGEKRNGQSPLTAGRRIGLGAIAFGAELVLLYTQYLVSSYVGGELQGMQARYFIPMWCVLAIALMAPQALRKRVDYRVGNVMTWVAFATCGWVNISYALSWLTSTGYL